MTFHGVAIGRADAGSRTQRNIVDSSLSDRFVGNFDTLAEARGGVQALRELVLDLARSGRLCDDGNAPSEGEVRESGGWSRHPLSAAFEAMSTQGKKVPTASVNDRGKYPVVDQGQMLVRGYVDDDACVIRPPRAVVVFGDHTRVVKFVDFPFVPGADGTKILLPRDDVEPRFFFWMLKSLPIEARGYGRHFARLLEHSIPIPPLAEQKRIVAKVDQLMALCDDLEARQTKKRETSTRLTKSALQALTTAEGPEEFDLAWKRVVDNFDVLIDRSEKVRQLRHLVLGLAVRGRLVSSNPDDRSVEELLAGIQAKRARLVAARLASRADDVRAVGEAERPFPIPASWKWVRFGEATICRDGQRVPVSKEERAGRRGEYDYYGASGAIDKIDGYLFDEPLLLIGEDGANLVSRSTPIAFIAAGRYWVNNHAHVIDSMSPDMLRYLEVFVNAIDLVPYVTGTAQPKMNQAKMNSIPVAVPPANEQREIVAKVAVLMTICDALEANMTRAEDRATSLSEAIVRDLVT
jgi:type I restriction enzyme S subunit